MKNAFVKKKEHRPNYIALSNRRTNNSKVDIINKCHVVSLAKFSILPSGDNLEETHTALSEGII